MEVVGKLVMTRYLFKIEYSSEKFCSFFVNINEQVNYSFVKLTSDIRSNIPSLQYLTPTTIRIKFRDDDGDFVNLSIGNDDMFKEMLKSGRQVADRDHIKIHLKVSELDSPANISAASRRGERPVYEAKMQKELVPPVPDICDVIPAMKKAAPLPPHSLCSTFNSVADHDHEDIAPSSSTTTHTSPLERYANKLENDAKAQRQKVELLKDEINDIDERLTEEKSTQLPGNLTVCGNCHLKLGHTARNCTLETCSDVFDCGFERFHSRQINRTKLNQELKKEQSILQKLENELRNRRSALRSMKESVSSQIENKLLRENSSEYHVGNYRNWSLLRRHVHLVETYCKKNFGGKIPPKQNLSDILRFAETDEQRQSALAHSKRRRVRENPAKSVLEREHGVCFPDTSVPTKSSSVMSCINADIELLRCEPRTQEEEDAQLDLAIKASACSTKMERQYNVGQCSSSKICGEMRHPASETVTISCSNVDVATDTSQVNTPDLEQNHENTDERDAANVLMSLLNS